MARSVQSGLVLAGVLAAMTVPLAAQAQNAEAESRALARCIELSADGEDRIVTARWLMGTLGSAPQLEDMIQIDAELKRQSDVAMAGLFTRLLTVDCLAESKAIFRRDASGAGIGKGFEVLGQIAVQELFGGDMSASGLASYVQYLDQADFEVLRN